MPERFKVTRSAADLGGSMGSGSDLRGRNGRNQDEEAAMGRLLPQRNYPGKFLHMTGNRHWHWVDSHSICDRSNYNFNDLPRTERRRWRLVGCGKVDRREFREETNALMRFLCQFPIILSTEALIFLPPATRLVLVDNYKLKVDFSSGALICRGIWIETCKQFDKLQSINQISSMNDECSRWGHPLR